jgi:hypothetical protein
MGWVSLAGFPETRRAPARKPDVSRTNSRSSTRRTGVQRPTITTTDIDTWLSNNGNVEVPTQAVAQGKGLIGTLYEATQLRPAAFGFAIDLKPAFLNLSDTTSAPDEINARRYNDPSAEQPYPRARE